MNKQTNLTKPEIMLILMTLVSLLHLATASNHGLNRLVLHTPAKYGLDKCVVIGALGTNINLHLVGTADCDLPEAAISTIKKMIYLSTSRTNSSGVKWRRLCRRVMMTEECEFDFQLFRYVNLNNSHQGYFCFPSTIRIPMDSLVSPFLGLFESLESNSGQHHRQFTPHNVNIMSVPDGSMINALPDDLLVMIAKHFSANPRHFMIFRAVCKRFRGLPLEGLLTAQDLVRQWRWWFGRVRPYQHEFALACSQGTTVEKNPQLFRAAIELMFRDNS